jgi:hypothetical protein
MREKLTALFFRACAWESEDEMLFPAPKHYFLYHFFYFFQKKLNCPNKNP